MGGVRRDDSLTAADRTVTCREKWAPEHTCRRPFPYLTTRMGRVIVVVVRISHLLVNAYETTALAIRNLLGEMKYIETHVVLLSCSGCC